MSLNTCVKITVERFGGEVMIISVIVLIYRVCFRRPRYASVCHVSHQHVVYIFWVTDDNGRIPRRTTKNFSQIIDVDRIWRVLGDIVLTNNGIKSPPVKTIHTLLHRWFLNRIRTIGKIDIVYAYSTAFLLFAIRMNTIWI